MWHIINLVLLSRNPRAHGTRVCTLEKYLPETAFVAIHVLMEHAFVRITRRDDDEGKSQSTCSWNTRLYLITFTRKSWLSRNPRAHGTRVCTKNFNHGLASASQSTCSWNTRLYKCLNLKMRPSSRNPRAHGTRVCTRERIAINLRFVAIHVLMEHAFVPTSRILLSRSF